VLTIQVMEGPAGGSLYVRDFAIELFRQGHHPVVYCPRLGEVAAQLTTFGIATTDSIDRVGAADILHGNSPIETAAAILRYPNTPAVFVCHGWDSPDALAPKFPQIMRYLAVSDISADRLLHWDGIAARRIVTHQNPVDLERFPQRSAPPKLLRRALAFSNTLTEANGLLVLAQACEKAGITLDVMGEGMGMETMAPEQKLRDYDLIFASGRAAMEALASGCAVILCDNRGLGELLTTENYPIFRPRNFGRRTMQLPMTASAVAAQITRYDAIDCAALTRHVREHEGLFLATAKLVEIYRAAIDEFRCHYIRNRRAERLAAARFLAAIAPTSNTFYLAQHLKPLDQRARRAELKYRQLEQTLQMDRLSDVELARIRLEDAAAPRVAGACSRFRATLKVHNGVDCVLSNFGELPMHLSYHWLHVDGSVAEQEGLRTDLYPPLAPHRERIYQLEVLAPEKPGQYILRLTLVQELVMWLDCLQRYSDTPVEIVPAVAACG